MAGRGRKPGSGAVFLRGFYFAMAAKLPIICPCPDAPHCYYAERDGGLFRVCCLHCSRSHYFRPARPVPAGDDDGVKAGAGNGGWLTDDKVVEIRQRYLKEYITQKELAAEYGVSQPAISKIVKGLTHGAVAGVPRLGRGRMG